MHIDETVVEYKKDGQTVRLNALWGKIQPGQKVICFHVHWRTNHPLASYAQPAAFTVVSDEREGPIILRDSEGREVTIKQTDAGYLYDAVEWGLFQYERQLEMLRRKQRKIEMLDAHLSMLKGILTAQGIRVVTAEQAKALGLS